MFYFLELIISISAYYYSIVTLERWISAFLLPISTIVGILEEEIDRCDLD